MSKFITFGKRPIGIGSTKTVYAVEEITDMSRPFLFTTNENPNDLVILIIPAKKNKDVDNVFKEYWLHRKFEERGLAPPFYGFAFIDASQIKSKIIRISPDALFAAGSFKNALDIYFEKYPQLKDAIVGTNSIAVLEQRCPTIRWHKIDKARFVPDIMVGISKLFDEIVEMNYIYLDTKLNNLCPSKNLKTYRAYDFDTNFVQLIEIYFNQNGNVYSYLYMFLMIYTDILRHFNSELHFAVYETAKEILKFKEIKQEDIRDMINTCYETCCEGMLPDEEMQYNPMNMIYYYRMDKEPDGRKRYMRTCEDLYFGIKEEIISYLLNITQPLFDSVELPLIKKASPSASASASASPSIPHIQFPNISDK